eukprot:TRINITY_DN86089_c0_g1_i1.p1 TRINITY_DN86089_c0_g1~~TRINITY_DN86089_c0_g1_i1.p1  ORF type:complete len:171 (-),score=33.30 TRINITY_DN86089_c0_g1_i1:72-584(-)
MRTWFAILAILFCVFYSSMASAVVEESTDVNFMEMGVSTEAQGGVQNFCEVCILMMQLKHNNKPQLCKGLAPEHWITCVEALESLLRADKALVYWEKNGCLHMDAEGPKIVKPCPALPVCSWVPNLFGNPPSIVRDGVESLCPKDNKYMPVIPPNFAPVTGETVPAMPAN